MGDHVLRRSLREVHVPTTCRGGQTRVLHPPHPQAPGGRTGLTSHQPTNQGRQELRIQGQRIPGTPGTRPPATTVRGLVLGPGGLAVTGIWGLGASGGGG